MGVINGATDGAVDGVIGKAIDGTIDGGHKEMCLSLIGIVCSDQVIV